MPRYLEEIIPHRLPDICYPKHPKKRRQPKVKRYVHLRWMNSEH